MTLICIIYLHSMRACGIQIYTAISHNTQKSRHRMIKGRLHILIAIVGFRNAGDVAHCLQALSASTWTDFEVVVCENGGVAAFADLKRGCPETLPNGQTVQLIEAPGNLGYAGGVNTCIRASSNWQAVWVLNPDTKPAPEALAALVEGLTQNDCDAIGGRLLMSDGRLQNWGGHWHKWRAMAISLGLGKPATTKPDPAYARRMINYVTGASMLVSRHFIETVGLMREDYFLYCEEVEWCLRGGLKGMTFGFAHEALVHHAQGTSTGAGQDKKTISRLSVYLDTRNRVLLTRDLFWWRLPVAVPAVLLHVMVRYGKSAAWANLHHAVAGWWAGVCNERGVPYWMNG